MSLQVKFKLANVNVEQFVLFDEKYNKSEKVSFSSGVGYKLDDINQVIGCFMKFSFEQNKTPFLFLEASCHFEIENKSWKEFLGEDEKIIIPESFMEHMAALTVGTARGILYAKTEQTEFKKFIIPLINVSEMINSDGVFKKN